MKAGFGTVANLEDNTTPEERRRLYAVAMLDGWGEEWQRQAAPLMRLLWIVAASGGANPPEELWPKTERDLEYWHEWASDDEQDGGPSIEQIEARLKQLAGV